MSKTEHFILFDQLPLIYGRVPKVANTSIKATLSELLQQAPEEGIRSTSDAFWTQSTHGETSLITPQQAMSKRGTHFCFSFVRNPFDRLVSAYNNKILELDDVTKPMKEMGLSHNMLFIDFIGCIIDTPDEDLDVHLMPQSKILSLNGRVIPSFVGQIEHIQEHWKALQIWMKKEGLPVLNNIPEKNVRRGNNHSDLKKYYSDMEVTRLVQKRYNEDIELFYNDTDLSELISGEKKQMSDPVVPLISF